MGNKCITDVCVAIFLMLAFIFAGCDKGLSPDISKPLVPPHGFKGVIVFHNWPPVDSIRDLRLAVFSTPPTSAGEIVAAVLQGRAEASPPLQPYSSDSIPYIFLLNVLSPGRLGYIAIGQQFGPNVQEDWRVVGLYYNQGDSTQPGFVDVPADSIVPDINISVDFNRLPPQPTR